MNTKNYSILAILIALCGSGINLAQADGFVCQSRDKTLNVKIYHHTDPAKGTRNAAAMIISDSRQVPGARTIATFHAGGSELVNQAATYVARMDKASPQTLSQFNEESLLFGERARLIRRLILNIDFSYQAPVANGAWMQGSMHMVLFDNDVKQIELDCYRYLKGAQKNL